MRGVRVDPERRVASVRGGSLLRELDQGAQEHGLACPVGVVGHTGVAGLTLGGGMGRLQRRWGFSIDNMLAVELVTAEGKQLRVSEEEHPDLFWGIRGAGPNFGIVTGFEFRLHELGTTITQGMLHSQASERARWPSVCASTRRRRRTRSCCRTSSAWDPPTRSSHLRSRAARSSRWSSRTVVMWTRPTRRSGRCGTCGLRSTWSSLADTSMSRRRATRRWHGGSGSI